MSGLVECVPNISEGRNHETVRALVNTVQSVEGIAVLDTHMDVDHHRAVVTFAGVPRAVVQAAFSLARAAATCIDLRQHQGFHPRVGATDVIPFVPLQGSSMEECVRLAREDGE